LIDMLLVLAIRHAVVWKPNTFERLDGTRLGTWLGQWLFCAPRAHVLIGALVLTRLLVFGVGWYSTMTAVPSGDPLPDRGLARSQEAPLEFLHGRWDASWYSAIAVGGGYTWNPELSEPQNVAFFPAFPLTVRWTTRVLDRVTATLGKPTLLGRDLVVRAQTVGVILNVLLFGAALSLLAKLGTLDLGPAAANAAVILAATWPFSVFFSVPYTESMFLCSILGAFYYQRRGHAWAACFFGVVAGLTKQTGWLLAGALAVAVWQRSRTQKAAGRGIGAGLVIAGPLIGAAIYSAYLWWAFGDPLAWFDAQAAWGPSQRWLRFAATGPIEFARLYPYGAANLLAVGAAVPWIWASRKIQWSYLAFGLVTVSVPLILDVVPLGRLTAVAFPVYLALAATIRSPSILLSVALVSLVFQLVVAYQFYGWRPLY
jgi:hypothetical protein